MEVIRLMCLEKHLWKAPELYVKIRSMIADNLNTDYIDEAKASELLHLDCSKVW